MVFPQGSAVPGFKLQTACELALVWFEVSSEFSPPCPLQRPSQCLVAKFCRAGMSLKTSKSPPVQSSVIRNTTGFQL